LTSKKELAHLLLHHHRKKMGWFSATRNRRHLDKGDSDSDSDSDGGSSSSDDDEMMATAPIGSVVTDGLHKTKELLESAKEKTKDVLQEAKSRVVHAANVIVNGGDVDAEARAEREAMRVKPIEIARGNWRWANPNRPVYVKRGGLGAAIVLYEQQPLVNGVSKSIVVTPWNAFDRTQLEALTSFDSERLPMYKVLNTRANVEALEVMFYHVAPDRMPERTLQIKASASSVDAASPMSVG
jgi:hypothetical protein